MRIVEKLGLQKLLVLMGRRSNTNVNRNWSTGQKVVDTKEKLRLMAAEENCHGKLSGL